MALCGRCFVVSVFVAGGLRVMLHDFCWYFFMVYLSILARVFSIVFDLLVAIFVPVLQDVSLLCLLSLFDVYFEDIMFFFVRVWGLILGCTHPLILCVFGVGVGG